MRSLTAFTLLLASMTALSAPIPEPTEKLNRQLHEELALPPLGVASPGVVLPLKLDLKRTDLLGKYADRKATSPELRKAVRETQVLLWASSPAQPPTHLREEVLKARSRHGLTPAALQTAYLAPKLSATAAFQNKLLGTNRDLARMAAALEKQLETLQEMGDARDRECPRWQANFNLVMASLIYRLAYLGEHGVVIGDMRKELPPRNAMQRGWKLVPRDGLRDSPNKRFVKAGAVLFSTLTREHAGTAWAQVAEKLLPTPLSVEWAPLE